MLELCDICINSRNVVSENGEHSVCTLDYHDMYE